MQESGQIGSLSVTEVMRGLYDQLAQKFAVEPQKFSQPVYTIIADDSDHHRRRRGNMMYEDYLALEVGGLLWVVTLGRKAGSYPADPYDSDLTVFPTQGSVDENARFLNRYGDWWRYSLVMSHADGNIGTFLNPYGTVMGHHLSLGSMPAFVAAEAQQDEKLISLSTLQPVVTRETSYKPEVVLFLVECVVKSLEDCVGK